MIKILTPLFILLFFLGCAKKLQDINIFAADKPYVQAMRYTKKGDIAVSLENKALLIATYLNPLLHKSDKEYFFIRVYIDNDFEDEKRSGLFHPGFFLTLNGQKPLKIKQLSFDDPLVKKMPYTQKWYKLYVVIFPKSSSSLRLDFGHKEYGKTTLNFVKE